MRFRPRFGLTAFAFGILAALLGVATLLGNTPSVAANNGHPIAASGNLGDATQSSCVGRVEITEIFTDRSEIPVGGTVHLTVFLGPTGSQGGSPTLQVRMSITDSDGELHHEANAIAYGKEAEFFWPTDPSQDPGRYYVNVSVRGEQGDTCHATFAPGPGDGQYEPIEAPSFNITPGPHRTDLGIEIADQRPRVVIGESLDIGYRELNGSNTHTGRYNTDVYFVNPRAGGEIPAKSVYKETQRIHGIAPSVPPLAPEAIRISSTEVIVPDADEMDPGEYRLCVRIEYIDPVIDSDPSNNVDCVLIFTVPDLAEAGLSLDPIAFPNMRLPIIDNLPYFNAGTFDVFALPLLQYAQVNWVDKACLRGHDGSDSPHFWVSVPTDLIPFEKGPEVVVKSGLCRHRERVQHYRALALELATREEIRNEAHMGIFDVLATGAEQTAATTDGLEIIWTGVEIGIAGGDALLELGGTEIFTHSTAVEHAVGPVLSGVKFGATQVDAVASALAEHGVQVELAQETLKRLNGLPMDSAWSDGLAHADTDLDDMTSEDFLTRYFFENKQNFDKVATSGASFAASIFVVVKGGVIGGVKIHPYTLVATATVLGILESMDHWDQLALSLVAAHIYGSLYDPDAKGNDLEMQAYNKFLIYDHAYKGADNRLAWVAATFFPWKGNKDRYEENLEFLRREREDALQEAIRLVKLDQVKVEPPSISVKAGSKVLLKPKLILGSGRWVSVTQNALNEGTLALADMRWTTTDVDVATVSNVGEVVAVGPGKAEICAESQSKTGCTTVTVGTTAVAVASVEVSPPSASITVAESTPLTARAKDASGNVLAGRSVTWNSLSPGLATVSADGTVTGKAQGTATITATAEGVAGRATVTVSPEMAPIVPGQLPRPPGPLAGVTERDALEKLYEVTDGDGDPDVDRDGWDHQTNWLRTDLGLGSWYNVGVKNGVVTELTLGDNNLVGTIPKHLGNLSNLEKLYLHENKLTGSIPPHLGNLSELERLELDDNELTGSIPPHLGNLSELERLKLYDNELTGSIPSALGNLSNLEWLWLENNRLTGSIPPHLGNLSNLEELKLNHNDLTGSIPAHLGNLSNLELLWLYGNELTGSIPAHLGDLEDLEELLLGGNRLTGPIPTQLGDLTDLEILDLSGNETPRQTPPEPGLTGRIPSALGDLTKLLELELDDNSLTGPIPSALGNLTKLTTLDLSDNQLTGNIPAALENLVNLEVLYLSDNDGLTGCIPERLTSIPDNDLDDLQDDLGLEVCGTPVLGTWASDAPSFNPAALPSGGGSVTVEIYTQEPQGTPTPVTAPSMSVSGPGLDLTNTASPCAEAQREIGSYIERCWIVTFEAPPNESTSTANSYEVTVRSDLVQGEPVGEITVAAAPAILEKPGETNNLEKPGETTTEPEPAPVVVDPGTTPSLLITLLLMIGVVLPEIELDYDDDDGDDDDGAPTQTDTQSQATGRVKASFQKFYVIDVDLDEYGDHDRECKLQLGGEYRLADWNDLTEYYAAGGSIPELISGLNWKEETTTDVGVRFPRVSKDGNERWGGGRRHYFVSRHDHVRPGYFLVHNHIDNYHLSLGSWYGEGGEALCFRLGAAAVNTVVSGPAFARNPTQDFETLTAAGNNHPEGIWSDGTTMWVGDTADDKIYAYNLATKARDAGKDFNTLIDAGNNNPEGIWSDRTTMWVVDNVDDKIYAYDMATKARDTGKDFSTLPDADGFPDHIWSDRTTMWVTDPLGQQAKIYAYNLGTKARDAGKDFNTLFDAGNSRPEGIWSDGTTMWVADIFDDKIYAYNLGTKARDAGKDFNTLAGAGNNVPSGLWSDEATIWVGDYADGKIYAYNMPP